METDLTQRLVGAIVLIALAVIFIPMLLSDRPVMELTEEQENTNSLASDEPFNSKLVPVTPDDEVLVNEITDIDQIAENVEDPEPDTGDISSTSSPSITEATPVEQAEQITDTRVEQAKEEPPVQDAPPVATVPDTAEIKTTLGATQAWVVQLASFNSEENAKKLNQRLLEKKFESFIEPLKNTDGNTVIYRVRVGPPLLDKSKAEAIREQLKKSENLDGIVIEYP